ncbi:hypothetical protein [Deinococcus arenicola]|uniref:Uncharacterized protein n=1 Tax=Deinococcus arenicola TaxID=2994950 RepID=A0ABU4DQ75_9DEIO|nr:hypothetical protein [Deinococcus sp. ZS9-10]MDV6374582.1 hypothetical protein [Deinococcus sp. ZS9-10]
MTPDRDSSYPLGRAEPIREHLAELVELYEYRVAAALQGQRPRGGRRSLADLREALMGAALEPALYRRLLDADRQYRDHQKVNHPPQVENPRLRNSPLRNSLPHHAPQPGADRTSTQQASAHQDSTDQAAPAQSDQAVNSGPTAWEAPVKGDLAQTRAWQELHLLAWGDVVRAALQSSLPVWHCEPDLLTLRVLYTAVENAERAEQAGLAGQVFLDVPARHDPLTNLDDPQVLSGLIETAVTLLIQPNGRERLEAALSQIHETPFPRHPDEDVLRARMAAAEREPLAPRARDSLVRALRDHAAPPRDPRERPAIREVARQLAHALEPLLASEPQTSLGGVPSHSVLYAAQPGAALRMPDDGATELVVRLAGAQGMRWRGIDFHWQASGQNWQLQAAEQRTVLRPHAALNERHATLRLPHAQIRVFVSGLYMLLRVRTSPQAELTRLASLGRAVSVLLDPTEDYAALRLARAAAQCFQGTPIDPNSVSPSSAACYALASPNVLLSFARRGAEALCAHLVQRGTAETELCLRDSAQALNLQGNWDERLTAALITAVRRREPVPRPLKHNRVDLPLNGTALCVELRDDPPLTLQFGERAMTLRRDFHRECAVILPGHPQMTLQDLLVVRASGFSLILARHGNWLTAAAEATPQTDADGRAQS